MDIQVASNFERLIYDVSNFSDIETKKIMDEIKKTGKYKMSTDKIEKIKEDFLSASLSVEEMKKIMIKLAKDKSGVMVDPHTAIGIGAIAKTATESKDNNVHLANTISLATAHPAKFPEAANSTYGKVELPKELRHIINEEENFNIMDNNLAIIKNYILKNI